MKWISTKEQPSAGKTKRWWVMSKDGNVALGTVKWHPAWRRFAFSPEPGTLFEPDCLRDLADFCEAETGKRKAERREEVRALAGDR